MDETDTVHFAVGQAYVCGLLANYKPDAGVILNASGFCAHDGRSEMTIKIDPIELHV